MSRSAIVTALCCTRIRCIRGAFHDSSGVRTSRSRRLPARSIVGSSSSATSSRSKANWLNQAEIAYAVLADVLLVQLHQVVDPSADRALGIDLEQHEVPVLYANVEQVTLADAQHPAQLCRYDHAPKLVDSACGAD